VTAKDKRYLQSQGVRFGCHVDLDHGAEPDGCVKDYGTDKDCIYAKRHRTREGCRYWQPIKGAWLAAKESTP